MRSHVSWMRFLWIGLSLFLFFLSGSGQDSTGAPGPDPINLPDENSDLNILIPGASALPDEANVNTVAPEAGPGVDYTSIQEAIDNSDSGDVILVQSGTYNETVTMQKPGLSVKGVDTGEGDPVVSGDGVESTVTLAADGCTVDGFVVINSGNPHAGISVDSDNNTITNNTVMNNRGFGIHLDRSRNNSIRGNRVKTNGFSGISVQNSSNNEIASNSVVNNTRNGIDLFGSSSNVISDNVVGDNGEHGIRLYRSDQNVLSSNIVSNNTLEGISIEDSEGTVTSGNVVINAEKTAMPAEDGETLVNFTIVVTNTGQVDLDKVRVTDELPAGLEYVSDNRSGRLRGGEVEWTLAGSLAANESAEIILSARFTGEVTGNLTNRVGATAETSKGFVSDEDSAVVTPPQIAGPDESISNAIQMARDGDVVEVKSGIYRENIVLDKSITLKGVDTGGGPPVLMGDGVGSTLTLLADGCIVEGFVVTGSGNPHAGIEILSGNNSISDNVIRNNRGYGVLISEARGNAVLSNQIRENGFDGVCIKGAGDNLVSDNVVSTNEGCGISLEESSDNVLSTNRISSNSEQGIELFDSSGNSILDNMIGGGSGHGIQLAGSIANDISGNVVSDNQNDGIRLEGSSENSISSNTLQANVIGLRLISSDLNALTDNVARINREHGISLRQSNDNTLSGNSVEENQMHGVRLIGSDDNSLADNDAEKNRGDGISFEGCSGNDISANTATGNQNGISLKSSSGNDISANEMEDNGQDGIGLTGSDQNTLTGNSVRENSGRGIALSSSRENTISGNTISANLGNGLNLASSNKNQIKGNNFIEMNVIGLLLSTSSDNLVTGNTIRENTLRGIRLTGSSRNSIYQNTFTNLQNARSEGGTDNVWSSPTAVAYRGKTTRVGNRWSDYSGWDCDGDGIGDWPYPIPGGSKQDQYPLTDRTGTRTITVCKSGGCDYTTIQAAVNAACPGGTVEVRGGTYRENVVVNKTLTLRGVDTLPVVGEGGGMPVVDAGGSGSAITISADGCTIEGFEVTNSGIAWPCAGIYVTSNDNTIENNNANENGQYGIHIESSGNNTLSDNCANGNGIGFALRGSSDITLSDNTATANINDGIYLYSSSHNTLSGNEATGNGYGISLYSSSTNAISGNTVTANGHNGISVVSSDENTLSENVATDNVNNVGIYLGGSSSNMLLGNIVDTNRFGIRLYGSSNNTLSDNTATDNAEIGILFDSSSGNIISGNTANGEDYGILLQSYSDNNTLSGNIATNNANGIVLNSSSANIISGNNATGNSGRGIYLISSSYNTLLGNDANDNAYGIYLYSSSNNTLSGNKANDNRIGIILEWSSNSMLSSNKANHNADGPGIYIFFSSNNKILGNIATDNSANGVNLYSLSSSIIDGNDFTGNSADGIYISSSSNNKLSNNAATYNGAHGIHLYSSNVNTISDNIADHNTGDGIYTSTSTSNIVSRNTAADNGAHGIHLYSSGGNSISDNIADHNTGDGIYTSTSTSNTISRNTATDNNYGIHLYLSSGNTFSDNIANGNHNTGIYVHSSSNNTIYLNEFMNNVQNGNSDSSGNRWNSTESIAPYCTNVGNRWSDYAGWDCDGDGIGDVPYEIPGGAEEQDEYPLTDRTGTRILTVCASGCNFTTIQDAINAACPGDTIEIHSGNYRENVEVNKRLTLRGVDTGDGMPVVDAGGSGSAITISADECTIEGFEVTNSGIAWPCAGIYVTSNDNTIENNNANENGQYGIHIESSGNNTLSDNCANGNGIGFALRGSSDITLSDNTATANINDGIYLHSSSHNTLSGNEATGNGYGISLYSSSTNAISGNTVTGNAYNGISLIDSDENTISDNTASDNVNNVGIYLGGSSNNMLLGNTANGNRFGIRLYISSNNMLSGNTVTGNWDHGIHLSSSSANTIYQNIFNSTYNSWSNSSNTWHSPENRGNLWSDYAGWDCDGDGIGDVPYEIPGGAEEQDEYPLTDRTGTRTLTVCASSCNFTNIQAAIDAACPGDIIEVHSGTYYEHVDVNKRLTLRGVDKGDGMPVVDAGNSSSAITISADGCTVEGIVARNSGGTWPCAGIYVTSNGNTISKNTAANNKWDGISLNGCSGNMISDNALTDNIATGIYLQDSNNNAIKNNTATDNNNNGIKLSSCSNNTILGNTASGNSIGIYLRYSSSNKLSDNTASDNGNGFILDSSRDNTIEDNTATDNTNYGIVVISSNGNTIYLNDFNNSHNAVSNSSSNSWNSTSPQSYTYNGWVYTNYTGNYWSDYNGSDSDGDGIGNTPRVIGGSEKDYRPMIKGGILTMTATALAPAILVDLSGDLASGSASNSVNLTLNVTNPGPESLTSVKVVALIPAGMSYLPGLASIDPDSVAEGENGTWNIAWEDVGDLGAGEFVMIDFSARIDGDLLADLTTVATATASASDSGDEGENGSLDESMKMSSPKAASLREVENEKEDGRMSEDRGETVSGTDSWTLSVQGPANPLRIEKTADPMAAEPGDLVTFSINVTNSGGVTLSNLTAADLLPAGMTCASADPAPSYGPVGNKNGTVFLNWTALPDLLPGGSIDIELVARVDDDARGSLTNTAFVEATYLEGGAIGFVTASDNATVQLLALNVTKTADKGEVKRGENITYNITVCNVGSLPLVGLVIEDVFDHQVEVISESISRGSDGRWHIDLLENDSCISIILIIKVPRQEFEFMMASRAQGEGFVNVADDYSTALDPFIIRNLVYAISDNLTKEYSDSASVTVLGEPGTELETREHGSGAYESEEVVSVRSLNKSIEMNKSVSATRGLTTLGLYHNRTVTFSSPWTEEATAKNRITGTSLSESYRYATSIDRESRFLLDQNESVMAVESEFVGMGHIGFLKKDVGEEAGSEPLFESSEYYTGSFRVLEKVDEYGSGIGSEKSASGLGLVAVDKRVGTSQRSYESGAGSYQSEELIRTETNYIGKDLSVERGQVNLSLSPGFSINSSMKWKEGMESRVANTSFLGEEYSGASRLDKETIAQGTNEMNTLANFTGKARYRAFLKDEIDFDEEYAGDYSVERRVLLKGVPRYERPHLSLRKEGEMVYPGMGASPLAKYTIILENDGDQSLGPVVVRDIFPPGAVYLNSSLRPSELAEGRATWTLTHLAIGDRFEIALLLNLTGYRGEDIVNQVEAEGGYGDNLTRARNFSALEIDWLRCCPSGDVVRVAKTGLADEIDPEVVIYEIAVENVGDGPAAVTLTDRLPDGMTVLEASPAFASLEDGVVTWNFIDLEPGETRTVAYRAQALWSGRFVNRVRADSSLVDGSKASTVYASCIVEVGEFEGEVPAAEWQPPDWGLNHSACGSDLEDEYLCEI